MGVSADSGNIDLSAAVAGGAGFAQRLAELGAAKEAYDKALNDLNLGKAAATAKDEAYRVLAEAKAKRDADMAALEAEVAKARASLNEWADNTKESINTTLYATNLSLDDAKAQQEAAAAANKEAQKVLADAKKEAASLVKDAGAIADELVAKAKKEADSLVFEAKKIKDEAESMKALATATRLKYEETLRVLKATLG